MKVLVIGGMHGNEPLGIDLVKLIQKFSVPGVTAVYGNEEAVAANTRFVNVDLNRSFPGSNDAKQYEGRRAADLIELTRSHDVVLDFHNTHCPDNDCTFLGETSSPILPKVSQFFGLARVITAPYDCINKYAPNCLSVEVSLSSPENDAQKWYDRIATLARTNLSDLPEADTVIKYRFVYRMTLEDRDTYELTTRDLKAFEPLSDDLIRAFGVTTPAYPIFINDTYTPYNFGGVVVNA